MFTVIYLFSTKPKSAEEFISHWEALTDLIYQYEGSYGSSLHRIKEDEFLAYARWPSKKHWEESGSKLPKEAKIISAEMKTCCLHTETTYEMDLVSDKLKNHVHKIPNNKPRVTGVGGVFFKSENNQKLKQWYADNLGIVMDEYGSSFEFRNTHDPNKINYLQWSLFKTDTDYFEPSKKDFMINYRVENIEELVHELKKNEVKILDKIESFDYGKFVHILDVENNKIELWEPIDSVFTDWLKGNVTK